MNNSAKHIFLLLLVITIGGGILQQHVISSNGSSSSHALISQMHCQQSQSSTIDVPTANNMLLVDLPENQNGDTESKTTTSCNTLVNLLHSESTFSFSPGSQSLNISFHNALLSSQIFVFQEPDPPQLG